MQAQDPIKRLFGALLMTVGGLIAGLCGLCSLGVLASTGGDPGGMFPVILLFGGPPIAVGVLIFNAGRKMWRGKPPPEDAPPAL